MSERHRLFWLFLAGGVLVGGIAMGVPHQFGASQPLSAADMNANFKSLEDRLARLETPDLCGQTANLQPGEIGGYSGARTKCTSACGVPAHMCTAHDLVMVTSTGRQISTSGWYASGLRIDAVREVNHTVNDCQGFRFTESGEEGPYWQGGGGSDAGPQTIQCDARVPVLCCRG